MSHSRKSALINVMVQAAEKAGRELARDFGEVENLQISQKGPQDFVSCADTRAEETLQYELSKARPNFGFLMEERGVVEGKDPARRFIIDPLDGTKNFLHGIPHCAVSIAAEENGKITAGVVHNPMTGEIYWAERGVGAFLNNVRLECTKTNALKNAFVGTGTPRLKGASEIAGVMPLVGGLRRMGSAALDICLVAAGKADGYWARDIEIWDIAAAKIILTEARGRFTDIKLGKDDCANEGNYLATNGHIHQDLRQLLLNLSKNNQKTEKVAS